MNAKQADYPPTSYIDPSQPINITGALPWATHITYHAGTSLVPPMPYIDYREQIVTGTPHATYHPGQVDLTDTAQEHIRQIVREEVANALCVHQQQELDSLLEAIQGEPDPDDEIAAILAEYTEKQFNELVQRVKEMKRE